MHTFRFQLLRVLMHVALWVSIILLAYHLRGH